MDLVETSERASNLLAIENEQLEENNGSARLGSSRGLSEHSTTGIIILSMNLKIR